MGCLIQTGLRTSRPRAAWSNHMSSIKTQDKRAQSQRSKRHRPSLVWFTTEMLTSRLLLLKPVQIRHLGESLRTASQAPPSPTSANKNPPACAATATHTQWRKRKGRGGATRRWTWSLHVSRLGSSYNTGSSSIGSSVDLHTFKQHTSEDKHF